MDDLQRRAARALEGNLATQARQARAPEQAVRPRPARPAARRGLVRRGRAARQRAGADDDLPADGVVTGIGHDRRPAGVRDGQRPDGEGGLVGRAHGREDRPPHRARAAPRAARLLARRLRGRAHHRSGRAVPRTPRRGPHLRQPGAAVGQGAAGRAACSARRRRAARTSRASATSCSWSRATRRCTSARRAWPRW